MATASLLWIAPPTTTPGGKPVTALPGLTPTLPLTVVAPVLVTVEPPRTPKFCAVPREICAEAGEGTRRNCATPMTVSRLMVVLFIERSLSWAAAGFEGTAPVDRHSDNIADQQTVQKKRQVAREGRHGRPNLGLTWISHHLSGIAGTV